MVKYFILALLVLTTGMGRAQEHFRVMFYNVENLFDTHDDPLTRDEEFTPAGAKHWTQERYMIKLKKLAEVVDSVGEGEWPLVVGMAEVENRRVLEDFTEKTILADGNYGIVHGDSPDRRGIDVALLYRKDCLKILDTEFLRLSFPEDTTIRTRDVLYAKSLLQEDTIHFFVCHFPSMIGGEKQSEWRRQRAAEVVRYKVDSLFRLNPSAAILIMGDLNGKANTLAQKTMRTRSSDKRIRRGELYNTGYYLLKKSYGSYRYKGNWQTIDHIIVSGGLLLREARYRADRRVTVYSAPFLLEEDKTYFGFKPRPTYRGPRYIGGYSDHLPLYVQLRSAKKGLVDRDLRRGL